MDTVTDILIRINGRTETMTGQKAKKWLDQVNNCTLDAYVCGVFFPHFEWKLVKAKKNEDQIWMKFNSGKEQYLHGEDARKWMEAVQNFLEMGMARGL